MDGWGAAKAQAQAQAQERERFNQGPCHQSGEKQTPQRKTSSRDNAGGTPNPESKPRNQTPNSNPEFKPRTSSRDRLSIFFYLYPGGSIATCGGERSAPRLKSSPIPGIRLITFKGAKEFFLLSRRSRRRSRSNLFSSHYDARRSLHRLAPCQVVVSLDFAIGVHVHVDDEESEE